MFVTLDRRPGFEGGDTALHGLILGSRLLARDCRSLLARLSGTIFIGSSQQHPENRATMRWSIAFCLNGQFPMYRHHTVIIVVRST
jgi:hypothetical protein